MEIERTNGLSKAVLDVITVKPEDLHVLRETHKYIFFGPMRKDLKNTYFGGVYLFEKKLRIHAGQKVILSHSKEVYGVALVGQAQNRQVWVWLVSFQTEDVVKRLIVQVSDIVGTQNAEETQICRSALARYQRRSHSYAASLATVTAETAASSSDSSMNSPLSVRRLTRSHSRTYSDSEEPRPKRPRRRTPKDEYAEDDFVEEEEEDEDSFDEKLDEDEEEEEIYTFPTLRRNAFLGSPMSSPCASPQRSPPKYLMKDKKELMACQRQQCGELFMTLLECVAVTLASEYPQMVHD